jgi:hypothetical protein
LPHSHGLAPHAVFGWYGWDNCAATWFAMLGYERISGFAITTDLAFGVDNSSA